MDPTEIYNRMDQLTSAVPGHHRGASRCRTRPDGYQRPGMAMMAGTTNAERQPERGPTRRSRCSCSRRRWATWAATTSPPSSRTRARRNSPLSITVTDGTWRDGRPRATPTRATGSARSRSRSRTSSSTWPPTPTGALTSTAAQVIAAINADPAASALVTALLVRRQRRRRHRPGDAVAQLQHPERDDRHADVRLHQGPAVGLPARRHGLLGRQRHRHPARRSCARTRATSPRARST